MLLTHDFNLKLLLRRDLKTQQNGIVSSILKDRQRVPCSSSQDAIWIEGGRTERSGMAQHHWLTMKRSCGHRFFVNMENDATSRVTISSVGLRSLHDKLGKAVIGRLMTMCTTISSKQTFVKIRYTVVGAVTASWAVANPARPIRHQLSLFDNHQLPMPGEKYSVPNFIIDPSIDIYRRDVWKWWLTFDLPEYEVLLYRFMTNMILLAKDSKHR